LKPSVVLWFGVALSVVGSIYLAIAINALASLLAILTLLSYLFLYTPLKRKTPLCILVGAFPGAMPPLIGWAAASGRLSLDAWILYGILFLWQFPHFMSIAWMYREDYDRAGYLVLPRGWARDHFVTLQTILPLLVLLPVGLLCASAGRVGVLCLVGNLLLGLGFCYYGAQFVLCRSSAAARQLLTTSIFYLPLQFLLLAIDKG
jgi:heme o synthase